MVKIGTPTAASATKLLLPGSGDTIDAARAKARAAAEKITIQVGV